MMPKLASPKPMSEYIKDMEAEVEDLKKYLKLLDPDVDIVNIRKVKQGIKDLEDYITGAKMRLKEWRIKNGNGAS